MENQKIMVTQSTLPPFEEYVDEIKKIWDTHWLTNMGPFHQKFQGLLEEYFGVNNISLFTNGHLSLELLLQAYNLEGEVITTPFTFSSTTHAIVRNGLKPVFCDINSEDFTIDVNKIEELITKDTSAIVPVHVYGNICDVDKIDEIAKRYNLKVIYDAAHAFGVKYKGINCASFGDASMYSFHATKVFNTIEGGCAVYRDPEIGKILDKLKNFGITDAEHVDMVGSNGKMNEFQAAMGICNLRHLEESINKRKQLVELYDECLSNIEGLQILKRKTEIDSNYAYYPIIVDERKFGVNRDILCKELELYNIFARKYFYPLTSEFGCYKQKFDVSHTPVAKKIAQEVLTLPLYPDLPVSMVEEICEIIKNSRKK